MGLRWKNFSLRDVPLKEVLKKVPLIGVG